MSVSVSLKLPEAKGEVKSADGTIFEGTYNEAREFFKANMDAYEVLELYINGSIRVRSTVEVFDV